LVEPVGPKRALFLGEVEQRRMLAEGDVIEIKIATEIQRTLMNGSARAGTSGDWSGLADLQRKLPECLKGEFFEP